MFEDIMKRLRGTIGAVAQYPRNIRNNADLFEQRTKIQNFERDKQRMINEGTIKIPPKEAEVITKQIQPRIQQASSQVPEPSQQPQQPQQPQEGQRIFSTAKYNMKNPGEGSMTQPPPEVVALAEKYFQGEDVDKAIIVSLFESGYQATKPDGTPKDSNPGDGSIDRGLMQINSNTFNEYMQKMPNKLAEYGITSWEDMNDPDKNMAMASIIVNSLKTSKGDRVDWDRWYGPAANGYNVYSSPDRYEYNRQAIENWKANQSV